jgi:hypothetical protein
MPIPDPFLVNLSWLPKRFLRSLRDIQNPAAVFAEHQPFLHQVILVLSGDFRVASRASAALDRGHGAVALGGHQAIV